MAGNTPYFPPRLISYSAGCSLRVASTVTKATAKLALNTACFSSRAVIQATKCTALGAGKMLSRRIHNVEHMSVHDIQQSHSEDTHQDNMKLVRENEESNSVSLTDLVALTALSGLQLGAKELYKGLCVMFPALSEALAQVYDWIVNVVYYLFSATKCTDIMLYNMVKESALYMSPILLRLLALFSKMAANGLQELFQQFQNHALPKASEFTIFTVKHMILNLFRATQWISEGCLPMLMQEQSRDNTKQQTNFLGQLEWITKLLHNIIEVSLSPQAEECFKHVFQLLVRSIISVCFSGSRNTLRLTSSVLKSSLVLTKPVLLKVVQSAYVAMANGATLVTPVLIRVVSQGAKFYVVCLGKVALNFITYIMANLNSGVKVEIIYC